jgi:hypothetical protein
LRTILEDVEAGLDSFAELIGSGEMTVAELLLLSEASGRRGDYARAMEQFEESRRRLRVAVLRYGIEQGDSVADLARALGISRQLAYRHLDSANADEQRPRR